MNAGCSFNEYTQTTNLGYHNYGRLFLGEDDAKL